MKELLMERDLGAKAGDWYMTHALMVEEALERYREHGYEPYQRRSVVGHLNGTLEHPLEYWVRRGDEAPVLAMRCWQVWNDSGIGFVVHAIREDLLGDPDEDE